MKKILFIFIAVLFVLGCNTHAKQENIALNNGEKWKVNEEMKPFLEESNEILNNYIANNNENYTELAENLKNENFKLIKSCTMKGESHEELHKWLHPHMELIEKLAKAENQKEANKIIKQLKDSFAVYHNYFE